MKYNRPTYEPTYPERHPLGYYADDLPHTEGSSWAPSGVIPTFQRGDLGLHSWQWPIPEAGPSHQYLGEGTTIPVGTNRACRRLHSQGSDLASKSKSVTVLPPLAGCNPDCSGHDRQRYSVDSPPMTCSGHWDLGDPCPPQPKKGFSPGGYHNPESGDLLSEDDDSLSPLDWHRKSLLASPFSEDSDSDDGLALSPLSSTLSDDTEEEQREHSLYSPSTSPIDPSRYQHIDQYPSLRLYHDSADDDQGDLPPLSISLSPLALSPTSRPRLLPQDPPSSTYDETGLSDSWGSSSNFSSDDSIRTSSIPPSHPLFAPYYDDTTTFIPDSPHHRSSDLPSLDDEPHVFSDSLGLSSTSTSSNLSPLSSLSFDDGLDMYPQRASWLSLPGSDTDDDLIPADLASKNYIPDPSIAVPTTPPSRSLLIWDPTSRSGLPPGIPTFDGTGRPLSQRYLLSDVPSSARSPSPDENFEVDPNVVAELAKQDAEKGLEAQKVYELRQRTTMAAVAAATMAASKSGNKDKEVAQLEAEKVKERWRELTALLRLKLKSDGKKSGSSDSSSSVKSEENNGDCPTFSPPDASETKAVVRSIRSSSLPTPSLASIAESAELNRGLPTSSPPQSISRRSSKPKITSMAQLVANMVLHRQQEALRRSPRARTWPSPSSSPLGGNGKKALVHATPKSPLRQVTLPDDVEGDSNDGAEESESPLQLSPLCLGMCQSPESFYGCLDAQPTSSHAGLEGRE